MVLTTESLVTDLPEPAAPAARWIPVWECINLNNIKHRLQNAVCVLRYVLTKLIYSYIIKIEKGKPQAVMPKRTIYSIAVPG